MTESTAQAPKANGLQTALNTIAAPREAFAAIRIAPTWGWAYIIAAILIFVGGLLFTPASQHAAYGWTQHFLTTKFAESMTDAKKQQMLADAAHPSAVKAYGGLLFNALVLPFIVCAFNALFLLIGNAIGRGAGSYKQYFASSMNVLIPSFGLYQIVTGIIGIARGADTFNGFADLFRVMPSLAWVFNAQHGYALGFLSFISVFSIWGAILNALSLKVIGDVRGGVAWTFAILILVLMAAVLGLTGLFS